MARAIDKRIMLDLIIEAKKTDPETGPFSEWLAEYLVDHLPTIIQQNEWVSVEERLPEPGERVLAAKGTFVGEAYLASNGAWMRHDGFPWEVDAWMPLPAPPGKGNNVPTNEPLTIEELREMDGRPVYLIVDDGYEPLEMWALIDVPEKDHIVLINNIGGRSAYYSDDDLERDHITVYRRPPEAKDNNVPTNEPLTIEELREMNGEPVWVVLANEKWSRLNGWYLVHHGNAYLALVDDWELDAKEYGVEWIAYRRPPEGEEDT